MSDTLYCWGVGAERVCSGCCMNMNTAPLPVALARAWLSTSSISVPAPDCLLWHTPEPEAGEHPLSAPQANVRSCRVASGFLRYLPSSCRKALTFGSKWAPSYLTSFSLTGYLIPSNRSIFPLASCKSRPWLEDFQCAVYPVLVENTSHVAPSSW